MRRALRLALGLGLGFILVLAQFSVARAHAILLSAAPNPNGLFPADAPPAQVQITFSEEVVPSFSDIRVFDETGTLVTVGDLRTDNRNRTNLAIALRPLPPGLYTVAWRVLSAVDGHTSSGSYAFGVGVTPIGQTAVSPPTVSAASLGSRWLGLTGLVLLLGLFAFHLFVWRPALREAHGANSAPGQAATPPDDRFLSLTMARQSLRVGWVGIGLVGLGLMAALAGQGNILVGSDVSELVGNLKSWLATRYGGTWLIRLWLSVALTFLLADLGVGVKDQAEASSLPGRSGRGTWAWWAGLALSAAAGMTATAVSHSAARPANGELAVIGDAATHDAESPDAIMSHFLRTGAV